MLKVPHEFQLHVSHSCNLTCEGCTHYMNQGHTGNVSLETAIEWMDNWKDKVIPKRFTLMGGEPCIHPDLGEFVWETRKRWPNSYTEVVTNGFLLHRHPNLYEPLRKTRTVLAISVHSNEDKKYLERFKPVYELAREWIDRGVEVELRPSIRHWQRQYKGFGDKMEPYEDNDPVSSWDVCVSRLCVQLWEGKLWKCPGLAYLPMQAEKYNLSDKWNPYLKYVPLSEDSDSTEIKKFFLRKAESFCSMCPANAEYFKPADPLLPLGYWKKLYDT